MADKILNFLKSIATALWIGLLVIALMIGGCASWGWWINRNNHIAIEKNRNIDITPQQIQSIQQIGQWEFLSVSDEEIADTVSRGFFSDSELARIYYGTLRLGIDLHKAGPKWLQTEDSTAVATLPPIELLDRNFIDEARTRPFIQSGHWTDSDYEALYWQAYRKMIARCMTAENIRAAEDNARSQFTNMLRSMGFSHITVEFEKPQKPTQPTS